MPCAAGEEGEEASVSRRRRTRSRSRPRPRRSESLQADPTAVRPRGRKRRKRSSSTPAVPVIETAARWRLQSKTGIRNADAAVTKRRRKSNRKAGDRDDKERREAINTSMGDETLPLSDGTTRDDEETEQDANYGNQNPMDDEGKEEDVSSAPSSPLCEPYIPREVTGWDANGVEVYKPIDSETFRAYEQSDAKFNEKLANIMRLPTLDSTKPSTCLVDPKFLQAHDESASKTVVLAVRKSVFSSSVGGEPLTQCTGFLIDSDQDGTGIILTSAHLIRTKHPSLNYWLCRDEYTTDAEVTVHLPDNTIEKGHLLYYQKHYNIALFRSTVNLSVEVPRFSDNVRCGQMIFKLGRDQASNMRISYGRVQFLDPNLYERYHFMYASGAGVEPKCATGGPTIDLDGNVVGMSNATGNGSFVPTAIILKWKHLWRNYGCIPRPHLGLKLWSITFLDITQIEKIFYKCELMRVLSLKRYLMDLRLRKLE